MTTSQHTYIRLSLAAFAVAALLFVLLVSLADAAPAAGTSTPNTLPRSISATGKLSTVTCAGPCCCGTLSARYMGHWYETTYCKWWRPLRTGQTVTARVYLQRTYR